MPVNTPDRDAALLRLLCFLAERRYRFTTPTPLTHSRVLDRAAPPGAATLRDIFGWNRPFATSLAEAELLPLMQAAGVLEPQGADFRSKVRVSTLGEDLFVHSAYPTLAADTVFFGPDTYRFANFLRARLPAHAARCVDIGCGSGAGAIAAARHLPGSQWLLTDINPEALRLATINAQLAGLAVETALSDVLAGAPGNFDLVICNPPYLADASQRAYRHGGDSLGRELSLRIVREACERLRPGGRLLLYTGVAIVDGADPLLAELRDLLDGRPYRWDYAELDPDVFGEELERPEYATADRIAVIGLVLDQPS